MGAMLSIACRKASRPWGAPTRTRPRGLETMSKWLKRIALLVLVLVVLALATGWWLLRGSVPTLEGNLVLPGLSQPVQVQRDALGIVTIDAANEADMARALGYVHAQERFFEMDLMRRSAAGELAELLGPRALETDQHHRVHRIRARVEANLDAFAGARMAALQAYADGVNAGLADLRARPWPYLVLRQQPRSWTVADSALAGYTMYFDLQDAGNKRELALHRMRPELPPALFDLLVHAGSEWDAPLAGLRRGNAVLPSAAQVDLRKLPTAVDGEDSDLAPASPGSNNWAVAGSLTGDGRALVADDMHLGLRAPNIWLRARLRHADPRAPGGRVDVSGFTLPGLPAVIVGSNGHVAWGFTNAYGDWADWAVVKPCAHGQARQGQDLDCDPVTTHAESIQVSGGDPVILQVRETAWGPILHEQDDGESLALRWLPHLPGAVRADWSEMALAADLDAASTVADRGGIPAQNLVMADRSGRIGWRLLGAMPARAAGCDPTRPRPRAQASTCPPWSADARAAPRLLDPPSGRLWSANNRLVDGATLEAVGDGGYALGARGRQIRDRLFQAEAFDERDLLALQLDDRALFLQRWWALLQREGAADSGSALAEMAGASRQWEGRASTGSVSYRLVRAWRLAVHERIADGLMAPARAALGEDFEPPSLTQLEGVVWPLLEQRPAHLLAPGFDDWSALLEDAARDVRDELAALGPLSERTWGERNRARICHPLAGALPGSIRSLLCMPDDPLPGDTNMPLVQGPSFGASQRMVVSPGREAEGIANMPGGQSGHPLSPFWGAGHDDWVHGRATPFLPGEASYRMTLQP